MTDILEENHQAIVAHYERYCETKHEWLENNAYFYEEYERLLKFIVEPGKRVLVLRSQTGFLLNAVQPERGLGIELNIEASALAAEKYPHLEFASYSDGLPNCAEKFDYIIHERVGEIVDLQALLLKISQNCLPHTRVVLIDYNKLWEPIVNVAERFQIKMPTPQQNWLSRNDVATILEHSNYQLLKTFPAVLVPKYLPILSTFCNRVLAKLPLIENLSMLSVYVCRPLCDPTSRKKLKVSVIIPCKNEEKNILPAVLRIPSMGAGTEIIFCDDKSDDNTRTEIKEAIKSYPEKNIVLVDGPGKGKAKNVWTGFEAATGDILMILDADLTVMPEQLPKFFDAITQGKGEFINGSRLVYPMAKGAMNFHNMLGNKFFGALFSFLLRQRIKDTLCGTKVLWRRDWIRMKPSIGTWGVEDHWGDYDLLFGAAKMNLRIIDLPIHYRERLHGYSKMVRVFQNGIRMLTLSCMAFKKLRIDY